MDEEQVSKLHPIDLFIDIRSQVLKGWYEQKRLAEQQMRRPATIAHMHYWLVAVGGYVLGTFTIVPSFTQHIIRWGIPATPRWLSFVVALLLWTLLIAPLSGWIKRQKRTWLLLIYTIIGLPLIIAVVDTALRGNTSQIFQNIFLLSFYAFIFLLLITSIMFTVGGSIPEISFLLITSLRSGKHGLVFPSYETSMRYLINQLELRLQRASDPQVNQVAIIAQQKQTGINGRLQTLALASGSLALVGLVALIVAQDVVAGAVNKFFQALSVTLGTSIENTPLPSGVILLLLVLGLLIGGALRYAFHAYRELRLLEVINVACAFRLATHSVHTTPSPSSSTPEDMSSPNPSKEGCTSTLILFGFLAIVALVRRIFNRS